MQSEAIDDEKNTLPSSPVQEAASPNPLTNIKWITGWRLIAIVIGTRLALFMVQVESSVTSTAIVSITDDLGDFQKSSRVFTSYLLTFGGFPIIVSRLSGLFGRKQTLLTCIVMFVVFSGACGASQTMIQLIMFRWVKGIAAAGITAIGTLYGFELRPPEKWASYVALISFMLLLSMPRKLVLEPAARTPLPLTDDRTHGRLRSIFSLDFLGVLLLLGATILATASLQQAAEDTSFKSAQFLTLLILAPLFLLAFLLWQRFVTFKLTKVTPILSWDLLTDRVFLAAMMNSFLAGAVMTTIIVQIPQRFIIVNGLSALAAGIRLLPLAAVMASFCVLAPIVTARARIPVVYALLFAGIFMIAGTAGLSRSPTGTSIWGPQYGFQIIAGAGVGIVNVLVILVPPLVVDRQHLAVANGAIIQMRILGGALAVAIVTAASSSSLRRNLGTVLDASQSQMFLDRTETLALFDSSMQLAVREINGKYYNLQMTIMIGFAAAEILCSTLVWKREQIRLKV